MQRLIAMVDRAYNLAVQVQEDNRDEQVLQVLAEKLSGECGEFIALWNGDAGAFADDECMDPELVELVQELKARSADGPNDPEFLGRLFGA